MSARQPANRSGDPFCWLFGGRRTSAQNLGVCSLGRVAGSLCVIGATTRTTQRRDHGEWLPTKRPQPQTVVHLCALPRRRDFKFWGRSSFYVHEPQRYSKPHRISSGLWLRMRLSYPSRSRLLTIFEMVKATKLCKRRKFTLRNSGIGCLVCMW